MEDLAGGKEGVGCVEAGAEEGATDEGALDSNGHLHRAHEQDPFGNTRLLYKGLGTESKVSRTRMKTFAESRREMLVANSVPTCNLFLLPGIRTMNHGRFFGRSLNEPGITLTLPFHLFFLHHSYD